MRSMDEKRVVDVLRRLARRWPSTLWIYVGDGTMNVMRCTEDGRHAETPSGGVDPYYILAEINIPSDGGGW
jgi:hypothetical protein